MHIFNKNNIILCIFIGLCHTSPMLGMKRTSEATQHYLPLVADNIMQLPDDIWMGIITKCNPLLRNVLLHVCHRLCTLASKQNQNLLCNLDNVSREDKEEFLAKYLAEGNVPMSLNIMQSCPPETLLWLKKRWLLDYLDAGNMAMVKAILENCPKDYFKNDKLIDNYLLTLKWKLRAPKHGQGESTTIASYIENPIICQRLERQDAFNPNCSLQKLLTNQQSDLVASIERSWTWLLAQGNTGQKNVGRYITILCCAAMLNNQEMVKSILQTTPFKIYFNPIVTLKFLHDNQYSPLLLDAAQYSNAAIFTDIFAWAYPIAAQPDIIMFVPRINGMVVPGNCITPKGIEGILKNLIAMGKDQHLKPVMHYICQGPYTDVCAVYGLHSIGIDLAILEKKWSCLEIILDSINIEKKISCTYDQSIVYNIVLHETKTLPGPIPADYYTHRYPPEKQQRIKENRQKLEKYIKILKRQEPVIFEKLAKVSHKIYFDHTLELVNTIAGTLQLHPFMMPTPPSKLLENFIGHDPALINYIISVAQERRDTCVPGNNNWYTMLLGDPILLKYEQSVLDNVIVWLKEYQEHAQLPPASVTHSCINANADTH